jgi:hypothetical protein
MSVSLPLSLDTTVALCTSAVALRVLGGTLFLENINSGTWSSRLGGVSNLTVRYGPAGLVSEDNCAGEGQQQL